MALPKVAGHRYIINNRKMYTSRSTSKIRDPRKKSHRYQYGRNSPAVTGESMQTLGSVSAGKREALLFLAVFHWK